jgi:DNA-binding PadR family transcriptional regulator
MKKLSSEVLRMFSEMDRDRLDLHVMFESSGNEPAARAQVLDAVEELVREGFLRADGSDFYALTEKGRQELPCGTAEKPRSDSR